MFTGIVEKIGKIKKIEDRDSKIYFTIEVGGFLDDINIGDSISCDGVCLTVTKKNNDSFVVELMPETLNLSKFKDSIEGDIINLEKALKVDARLGGHFVMGHVDGVGIIKNIEKEGKYINLIISAPVEIIKFLAYKGSVSVNGVSLTISGSEKNWLKVSLITHTMEITNLKELNKGDKVNLEVDMIARYLEKLLK
jgi:riboflavin synthase